VRDRRLLAAWAAALFVAAGCSGSSSLPTSSPTPVASSAASGSPTASGPVTSSGGTPRADASPGEWDAFVASIDPAVRTAGLGGEWAITYTLVDFDVEGVDYKPYLSIGGTESWTWTVTPACPEGPCDVDFVAKSPLLAGTFPSSLDWLGDRQHYYSQGITPLPQAYCRDENGPRIPDSYQVEQTIFLVPTATETTAGAARATRALGVRVDRGMPVTGMPASCGTFTESYGLRAERSD
jgi:hypothetical protein